MAATGANITALAWETLDTESPTRAEYQANWNAVDIHNHDGAGKGLPVRSATSTAPAASGNVCVTGDDFEWYGTAVRTACDLTRSQTLTNKTLGTGAVWNGGVISHTYGGTDVAAPGTSGNVLTSNGTNWASTALPAQPPVILGFSGGADFGAMTQNTTGYANGGTWDVTQSHNLMVAAAAFTLNHMYVTLSTVVGGTGQTCTVTLQKNGVDTGLTVTINSGANTGNVASAVTFAAGDNWTFKIVTSATTGSFYVYGGAAS